MNSVLVRLEYVALYKMYWYRSLSCTSLSHKSLVLFHDYSHTDVTSLVWYVGVDILEFLFASRKLVATSSVQREGGFGVFKPPHPEIPKALQNRAKLNPIVKTVKNC